MQLLVMRARLPPEGVRVITTRGGLEGWATIEGKIGSLERGRHLLLKTKVGEARQTKTISMKKRDRRWLKRGKWIPKNVKSNKISRDNKKVRHLNIS